MIGTRLTELLRQRNYNVSHLGRSERNGEVKTFVWDITRFQMAPDALKEIDAVIHLAGASVADKPWSPERKQEILISRTRSTELLFHELKSNRQVRTFVSSSGINYYGVYDDDRVFKEDDTPADDFLANVTKEWEAEADKISTLGIRVVKIRTGIVLSERGGALEAIARPVKWYAGAPLGSGKQLMSWIHLDDICNMYIKAIEDTEICGVYNGVAPEIVTNKQFTKEVASALGKPLLLPNVPAFSLKLLFGEMADIVLKGCGVSCEKIQQAGFQFKFTSLREALADIYKKK